MTTTTAPRWGLVTITETPTDADLPPFGVYSTEPGPILDVAHVARLAAQLAQALANELHEPMEWRVLHWSTDGGPSSTWTGTKRPERLVIVR